MDPLTLSPLAKKLIKAFDQTEFSSQDEKISVNPVVSKVATFYENIRNAMEYQEEEVVFRAAIERILKRRLLLESDGKKVAEPLIKELAWAKYFPDNTVSKTLTDDIAKNIDLYVDLYQQVSKKYHLNKEKLNEWIVQVLSAYISFKIRPNKETQIISNFMFHIARGKITIKDDSDENKDALVFISVKRALAKEDKAFLRYHLFLQFFGHLEKDNFNKVLDNFVQGYQKIEQSFNHPLQDKIYTYIKRRTVPFIILRDLFIEQKNIMPTVADSEKLEQSVLAICDRRYQEIGKKVRTAIVRSVFFLFATKAIFALVIESSFEQFIYGQVLWNSLILNTLTPPLVMILMIFFISTPNKKNSLLIFNQIKSILYDENVSFFKDRNFKKDAPRSPLLQFLFMLLWFVALGIVITTIHYVLNLFHINLISQGIFVIFLVIVSFLVFRINQSAKVYNIEREKEGIRTVLFDFLFLPFIHLGRRLTLSFSRINIFLIVFDFIIEMPFKTLFAFFEAWFSFLRSQRETLD